jgi:GAF domain-containing protein
MPEHDDTLSVNSSTLLRKFLVFFIGFTLIPIVLLFVVFLLYDTGDYRIGISRTHLGTLILLCGAACLMGFFAMRSALAKIARLNATVRRSLLGQVDEEMIGRLAHEEGEGGELARSFSEVIGRLESNIAELEETKQTLHEVMGKVGRALSSMESFDSLLHLILETANEALGTTEGAIFGRDDSGDFRLITWVSQAAEDEAAVRTATVSHLQRVANEKRLFVLPVVEGEPARVTPFAPPLLCAPLVSRGAIQGALCLAGPHRGHSFNEEALKMVNNLGSQVAVSLENRRLSHDKERVYFETVSALALAVEARDPYSHGHSERVGELAVSLGEAMSLADDDIQTLRDASRLHDIGKIGITDSILRRPGPLDEDEIQIMRKHPTIGENIVAPLKTFRHLLAPIRHHHEQLNGEGYPDGLKGNDVSLTTRILAVADIYDALRGDRPYRKAMTEEATFAVLQSMADEDRIDGTVVGHLRQLRRLEPTA